MPPRFSLQGPDPYPVPTPPPPSGSAPPTFVPPTVVPGAGPTFGGATSTAPQVGVGWRTSRRRQPLTGLGTRELLGGTAEDRGYPGPEGFETQPADQVLNSLFDMPKPELRALQMKMYDAGYYGDVSKEAVVFGSVDDRTWEAYGDLLQQTAQYNSAGREVTWFELLDETQRLRKEQGTNLLATQGPKRAPFVGQTTNAADIERVAQHVASQLLGKDVDPALVSRIVSEFQAAEVSSQRGAYDAAATGGTVTDAPRRETFVADRIESADPTGTEAYALADQTVAAFDDIISGPFGAG